MLIGFFAKENEILNTATFGKFVNEYGKTRIGKIYKTKKNSFIPHCGIFIFYHTLHDFPNLHILPFSPLAFFPLEVIIILPG